MTSRVTAANDHPSGPPTSERSALTARAYATDLRDLMSFCESSGIAAQLDDLDDRRVFIYLASQVRHGAAASTVRRRITALRDYITTNGHPTLTVARLRAIHDKIVSARADSTFALVVSDDAIFREGLVAVLAGNGVHAWPDRVDDAVVGKSGLWDYVLVWLPSRRGIDPFGCIEWISGASEARIPIIALYPDSISQLTQLRLAEAGVRYAIPESWLSDHVADFPALLSNASLPTDFHLETPLALRLRLGLQPVGSLSKLLDAAAALRTSVWTAPLHELAPQVDRATILRLRRIAKDQAGIPPAPGRYSAAVRRAPSMPDWRELRRVVRDAFNLEATY